MYVIVSNTNSFGAKAIECYGHELDAISSGYKQIICFQQMLVQLFPGLPKSSCYKDFLGKNHGKPSRQAFGDRQVAGAVQCRGNKWGCWWFNHQTSRFQTPRDQPKYIPNTTGGLFFSIFFVENKCGNSRYTVYQRSLLHFEVLTVLVGLFWRGFQCFTNNRSDLLEVRETFVPNKDKWEGSFHSSRFRAGLHLLIVARMFVSCCLIILRWKNKVTSPTGMVFLVHCMTPHLHLNSQGLTDFVMFFASDRLGYVQIRLGA